MLPSPMAGCKTARFGMLAFGVKMIEFPIYVINLDRAQDRWKLIKENLEFLDLPFERILGFDGKLLNSNEIPAVDKEKIFRYHGRELTMTEIGCVMSHMKVWETIASRKQEFALVLEDDAAPNKNLVETLQFLAARDDWEFVHLGRQNIRRSIFISPAPGGARFVQTLRPPGSMRGYAIRNSAAVKLLDRILPIEASADRCIECRWRFDLNINAIFPGCVGQAPVDGSLIALESEKLRQKREQGALRYFCNRARGKIWFHKNNFAFNLKTFGFVPATRGALPDIMGDVI